MVETKLKLNDIAYFTHGNKLIKGIVDEIVVHYQQKETVVKYMIRPYGINNFVTIDACDVYDNIEEPKKKILNDFLIKYTKANIKVNYKMAKREMRDKFEHEMKAFEINSKTIVEAITNASDDYYHHNTN